MSVQRLNSDMRHTIMAKIMANQTSVNYKTFEKEHAALAERARLFGMTENEKRRFKLLPKGWLSTAEHVTVNVGGRTYSLQFSGGMYQYASSDHRNRYEQPKDVRKPVRQAGNSADTNDRYWGSRVDIPAEDPLGLDISTFINKLGTISEQRNALHSKAWAVLERCGTTKQLLDLWPEIAEFVPPPPPPANLPVIDRNDLNESFGLKTQK